MNTTKSLNRNYKISYKVRAKPMNAKHDINNTNIVVLYNVDVSGNNY
jgi:hypothetical protein